MATPTSMEKSAGLVRQNDLPSIVGHDLDLPVVPGFVSLPPRIDPERVLELSASFLPELMKKPGFWERRARDRCLAEFDLEHPERAAPTYPMALIDELFGKYLNP
jgi:hypothetical protein